MAHVFISYAHADYDEFVALYLDRIVKEGFDKWIDREQLAGGRDWTEDIDTGINEAYGLILIISNASSQSDYVKYEWAFALGQGVPVIPILYQIQDKLHPRLATIQYFDFTDPAWSQWDAFVTHLKQVRNDFGKKVRIPLNAPPEVRECLKELNNRIPQRRADGARELGQIGNPIAVPGLIIMLNDMHQSVQEAAAEALEKLGDERAAKPLVDCLVQYYQKGNTNNINGLKTTLDNKIAAALIHIGSDSITALISELKNTDLNVRMVMAIVLGRIKDKQAIAALIEASSNNADEAQRLMVWAMGQIADETCIPTIISILKTNASYSIRYECLQALNNISGKQAIDAIIEFLADDIHEISMARNFGHIPDSPEDIEQTQLRNYAASLLGDMGDKTAIGPLGNVILATSLPILANTARDSLHKLVENDDIDILISMLDKTKNQELKPDRVEMLLGLITSLGTSGALSAVEKWRAEQRAE